MQRLNYYRVTVVFEDNYVCAGMHKNYLALPEVERALPPGAPLTYFIDRGGGPSDFFGSEILAKSDFLGSMKDAGIFLGRGKKNQGFLGVAKKD